MIYNLYINQYALIKEFPNISIEEAFVLSVLYQITQHKNPSNKIVVVITEPFEMSSVYSFDKYSFHNNKNLYSFTTKELFNSLPILHLYDDFDIYGYIAKLEKRNLIYTYTENQEYFALNPKYKNIFLPKETKSYNLEITNYF